MHEGLFRAARAEAFPEIAYQIARRDRAAVIAMAVVLTNPSGSRITNTGTH